MANAPTQQSSSPEDVSRIYAEIKRLKQLKETVGWNDANWVEARQLHEEELNLDQDDSGESDDTPLHPLGEWLDDQIYPWEKWTEVVLKDKSIDIDQWVSRVIAILKDGFQDYRRFSKGGDLAVHATNLRLEYDLIDPTILQGTRWHELNLLRCELQDHLDPKGELHAARMQCFYNHRSEQLHVRASFTKLISGKTSSSLSIDEAMRSPLTSFSPEWNWHVLALFLMSAQQ